MHNCPQCQKETETVQKHAGPHLGEYCAVCDKWIRWIVQEKPYDPNWVLDFGKYEGVKISELETDYLVYLADTCGGNRRLWYKQALHDRFAGKKYEDMDTVYLRFMADEEDELNRLRFVAALHERYRKFITVVQQLSANALKANKFLTVNELAAEFMKRYPNVHRDRFNDYIAGIMAEVMEGRMVNVHIHIKDGGIGFETVG